MIKVNCPTCGVRLSAPDELINKPVNCQKCNTKFILSRRWTSEPLTVAGDGANGQGAVGERATEEEPITGPMTGQEAVFASTDLQSNSDAVNFPGNDSSLGSSVESNLEPTFDFTLSSASMEPASIINSDDSPAAQAPLNLANSPSKQQADSPALPSSSSPSSSSPSSSSPSSHVSLPTSLLDDLNLQPASDIQPTTYLQHFRETASIWQFFDFQFRGYLTPGIVRVSWFLILMVVTFWLLFLSYFFLSSVIQRKDFSLPNLQNQSTAVPGQAEANVLVIPQFFYNSAIFFTYTIASIIGLLWVRVLFETVMMVFCIGSHLQVKDRKSIRKK